MIPAFHVKRNIDFNKGFSSLLEVLKLIAVSQYHILERRLRHFEKLEALMPEFFESIDLNQVRHPFLNPGSQPMGVVAVTSDTGLLGGINMQVVTRAVDLVQQNGGRLLVVGERGQLYAQETGLPFTSIPGIQDDQRLAQAYSLRDYLMEEILSGHMGALRVVYPRALSFTVHRVETAVLLPFTVPSPENGQSQEMGTPDQIIFESEPGELVEYLVYLILGQRLFEIFGLSRLTEQAARFTHLEESCQKIKEMNQKLMIQYFRRRHEVIDANMRELFSARSLYAK